MKYFWVFIGILTVIALAFAPILPPDPASVKAARDETERVFNTLQAENEQALDQAKLRLWVARYGDTVAAKMYKCKHDPPRRPANQRWCQQMLTRDSKADLDDEAGQRREQANW